MHFKSTNGQLTGEDWRKDQLHKMKQVASLGDEPTPEKWSALLRLFDGDDILARQYFSSTKATRAPDLFDSVSRMLTGGDPGWAAPPAEHDVFDDVSAWLQAGGRPWL
jgi:hypothetical protein